MEELERYLAAHEHLLGTLSLNQTQTSIVNPIPTLIPQNSSISSRKPFIPKKMSSFSVSQPIPPSKSLQESQQQVKLAQEKSQLMKMEFRMTIDQFLNNYLDEWSNQRRHRLRKFLHELDMEQPIKKTEVDIDLEPSTRTSLQSSTGKTNLSFLREIPEFLHDKEERSTSGYKCSKYLSKSHSRLYSDISAHLRVIENTCQRYSPEPSTEETKKSLCMSETFLIPPERPMRSEIGSIRPISPPPPPPPLLLPSPKSPPHESHLHDSIISPLKSPNNSEISALFPRQSFCHDNVSHTTPAKPPSQSKHSISLDSPNGENEKNRNRSHPSTHFLVPGGLSVDHPTLSPHQSRRWEHNAH